MIPGYPFPVWLSLREPGRGCWPVEFPSQLPGPPNQCPKTLGLVALACAAGILLALVFTPEPEPAEELVEDFPTLP